MRVESDNVLSGIDLAVAVVRRVIDVVLVEDMHFNRAVEIAEEEIIARKAAGDYYLTHAKAISSDSLAGLIVDAMLDAKTIKEENFDEAVKVVALEIDVRKAAGDH